MRPAYKRWIETEVGHGMVEFSRAMGCYVWECEWGHFGYDCESAWEAEQMLVSHKCAKDH